MTSTEFGTMSSVWPSGLALATYDAPIAPVAPGRVSTITGVRDRGRPDRARRAASVIDTRRRAQACGHDRRDGAGNRVGHAAGLEWANQGDRPRRKLVLGRRDRGGSTQDEDNASHHRFILGPRPYRRKPQIATIGISCAYGNDDPARRPAAALPRPGSVLGGGPVRQHGQGGGTARRHAALGFGNRRLARKRFPGALAGSQPAGRRADALRAGAAQARPRRAR